MTFKTPDIVEDSVIDSLGRNDIESDNEQYEDEKYAAIQACKRWVKWGELLTVEVDTETGMCEVIPA
jgi:hypothetical protein